MSIATLLKYLLGNRQAILTIARTHTALWLGAIFVLSAAFAREYDGKDLTAEPWHLLVPFAASFVTSFVLFGLIYFIALRRASGAIPFWRTYRVFLTLYWLTAPLAWLYAIPVERFLSAGDAMGVNLGLLAIVALWRVLLMIRVVGVLFNTHPLAPVWPVMLFGDTVALTVLYFTPLPMFNIMGGVRLGEREEAIFNAAFFVGFVGTVSWLIWLMGTFLLSMAARSWQLAVNREGSAERVRRSLWIFAGAAVFIWLPLLPLTQPEQRLRHAVEGDFAGGHYAVALHTIAEHGLEAFPPGWDPPPNIAYAEAGQPALLDVVEVATSPAMPDWLRDLYVQKLRNQMEDWIWFDHHQRDLPRLRALFERIPTGKEIVRRCGDSLFQRKGRWADAESVAQADELLNWAGYEPKKLGPNN